jgi:hypothetical protein
MRLTGSAASLLKRLMIVLENSGIVGGVWLSEWSIERGGQKMGEEGEERMEELC